MIIEVKMRGSPLFPFGTKFGKCPYHVSYGVKCAGWNAG